MNIYQRYINFRGKSQFLKIPPNEHCIHPTRTDKTMFPYFPPTENTKIHYLSDMQDPHAFIRAFRADRNYARFVDELVHDEALSEGVLNLLQEQTYPFPEYSSWILAHVAKRQPEFLLKHQDTLLEVLLTTANQTVQRNLLGLLLDLPQTEHRAGELLDFCFRELVSTDSKVALKAYSMYMIARYVAVFPELEAELTAAMELAGQYPQTPAFLAAARKVSKQLRTTKRGNRS